MFDPDLEVCPGGREREVSTRAAILARLARLTLRDVPRRRLPVSLCAASRSILGADGASLTVQNGAASRTTLFSTDAVATRLDDLQDVLGEGPCRDAFRLGRPVRARLGVEPSRWPEFDRAAVEAVGPVMLHSFPMRPSGVTFGVLSVYVAGDHGLPESVESAQFLADTVGVALLGDADADTVDAEAVGGDGGPWSARAEVHQATGMVIEQLDVPAADALDVLRAHAYAAGRNLAEIAHLVITRQVDLQRDNS